MGTLKTTKKLTLDHLRKAKREQRKIVALAAYDASFARIIDSAEIDMVVVGDSLGMVVQGKSNTTSVTMDDMIYHSKCVSGGLERAFAVGDMPFMSCATVELALHNATRFIQEGQMEMVKIETHAESFEVLHALSVRGISCCAHMGLKPQAVHKTGGHKVQLSKRELEMQLLDEAREFEDAGTDMFLLECVPADLAKRVTEQVSAPVIGIGSGPSCDGQILVSYDVLGLSGLKPPFAKNFLASQQSIKDAFIAYAQDVRSETFPGQEYRSSASE